MSLNLLFRAATGLGLFATLTVAGPLSGGQSPLAPTSITLAQTGVLYGPYNGTFIAGGLGLSKNLRDHDPLAAAQQNWSLTLWYRSTDATPTTLLAGIGWPGDTTPRYLALRHGAPILWCGEQTLPVSNTPALKPNIWHALALSVDAQGISHLFADGVELTSSPAALGPSSTVLNLAPTAPWLKGFQHFSGRLAEVSLRAQPLTSDDLRAMTTPPSGLDNLPFEEGSKAWAVQTRASIGMVAPQDPATLPHSRAPLQSGHATPLLPGTDHPSDDGSALTLRHGWQLAAVTDVAATGPQIAAPTFNAHTWMQATVPGTVLTTLIDRGIYPDPDFGLNNMAIPESLAKQSFWYRNTFTVPASMRGYRLDLTFHGINYRATIWLNGQPLGEIVGAFRHKSFDVTSLLRTGENALAVRIDPPTHPGIPHEQSIAAGSGPNGGMMMLDGPTFGATEGWDWIPGIRDRNMGLWQDVTLTATGTIALDTPQIITKLPLPDRSHADITVRVPLTNSTSTPVSGTLTLAFDDVHITKPITLKPGSTTLTLSPADFTQLTVQHPRLWWPNGYGEAALHTMTTTVSIAGKTSATRQDRFGIREITYELSALDSTGSLRRVEVSPTAAGMIGITPAVKQNHESFRETPDGWVPTLEPTLEHSAAVRDLTDLRSAPFIIIRVNGVRIAIKGGAWGMDDLLKRVSRERLEPYFRLNKEANLNMARNWMGQDTEDVFYDLADEYGILIWNDFWESTQDYNLEPTDATLFLDNARDVITRERNHPSIAVWCGRNEGVPPPTINEGLSTLVATLDGTRYYSADSNKINLHDSGPYKYNDPSAYFTTLSLGFAVEVGIPSPSTMESIQASMSKPDQWPISDAWAYHDWHQDGNGDVAPFMQALTEQFRAPTSLADFDRKAQMLNYVDHRAVFEGMNAHLWSPNSGRLLWMTHPSWPSAVWQIYSHDYDTQASFYGVKKASEPIHIQMNLPDHDIIVVNNTEQPLTNLKVTAHLFDITGKPITQKETTLSAPGLAETAALTFELRDILKANGLVFVKLELRDASNTLLSENFYWLGDNNFAYRAMNDMPPAALSATLSTTPSTTAESAATVTLTNSTTTPAIATKLTLLNTVTGDRVLPAFYSDNYISLLPGETKIVTIHYPATSSAVSVGLRGWNIPAQTLPLKP